MKVSVTRNGVTRTAVAHVLTYSSFRLDADRSTALPNETVVFTPKYDGAAGPAAKWVWVPNDTSGDRIACAAGVQDCIKVMHGSGKMWAYSATTAGDSDYKAVTMVATTDTSGAGAVCPSGVRSRPGHGGRNGMLAKQGIGDCAPGNNGTTWPCSHSSVMSGRDSLIQQYKDTLIYAARDTTKYLAAFVPRCDQLDSVPDHLPHFSWSVVQSHSGGSNFDPVFQFALFRVALRSALDSLYNAHPYDIGTSNRIYSTPHHNFVVDTALRVDSTVNNVKVRDPVTHKTIPVRAKLAPNSRHVLGDAADINVPNSSETEWTALWNAAKSSLLGLGACVEPRTWSATHFHVDLRANPDAYNRQDNCSTLKSVDTSR